MVSRGAGRGAGHPSVGNTGVAVVRTQPPALSAEHVSSTVVGEAARLVGLTEVPGSSWGMAGSAVDEKVKLARLRTGFYILSANLFGSNSQNPA